METQIIISEDRYKELLEAEGARMKWQKYADEEIKRSADQQERMYQASKMEVEQQIKDLVDNGRYSVLLITPVKDIAGILGKVTQYIYKIVPTETIDKEVKWWKNLIGKR